MCGFIGVLSSKDNHGRAFAEGLLDIVARGVTVDVHRNSNEQYGYCRLPTDDVANANLQKVTERAGSTLLFNGLVTNVEYLVEAYDLPAAVSSSDTRCVHAGLQQHGVKFLEQCRGMFALAHITEETVTLARDTVGIKPLYYTHQAGLFAFASELKALRTIGSPIYEVLPGQIVTYSKDTAELTTCMFQYRSYKQYAVSHIETCLQETIVQPTQRYLAHTPKKVALLLSGGLDSSVIAHVLATSLTQAHKARLVAFCIGEDYAPDVIAAKKLAAQLELELVHILPYTSEVSLQKLSEIVYKTESPHARVIKVALLYNALAEAIKERNIDIVIGGEGADELFFGYHRFVDGLTPAQSERLFRAFFKDVFPYTLLQRYERIMARYQIEGRVPFLDQELIALADALPVHAKVQHHPRGGHTSKLPLRALAREIGLPAYIHDRPKEKMTAGATGRENATTPAGYLEEEAREGIGLPFQELIHTLYKLHFGSTLVRKEGFYTEETVMALATAYRQANQVKNKKGAFHEYR